MKLSTSELELEIYQQLVGLDSKSQDLVYKNLGSLKCNMISYGKKLEGMDSFGSKKPTAVLEKEIYQAIQKLSTRSQTIIKDNIKKIKFNMVSYGKKIALGTDGIIYIR